jgi:hypothetical protein
LTFESTIAPDGEAVPCDEKALRVAEPVDAESRIIHPRTALESCQQNLVKLHEQTAPLQNEINQLNRQFWVTKAQVKANKYDLSPTRYRLIEQDEVFYENPKVTLDRLRQIEATTMRTVATLKEMVAGL